MWARAATWRLKCSSRKRTLCPLMCTPSAGCCCLSLLACQLRVRSSPSIPHKVAFCSIFYELLSLQKPEDVNPRMTFDWTRVPDQYDPCLLQATPPPTPTPTSTPTLTSQIPAASQGALTPPTSSTANQIHGRPRPRCTAHVRRRARGPPRLPFLPSLLLRKLRLCSRSAAAGRRVVRPPAGARCIRRRCSSCCRREWRSLAPRAAAAGWSGLRTAAESRGRSGGDRYCAGVAQCRRLACYLFGRRASRHRRPGEFCRLAVARFLSVQTRVFVPAPRPNPKTQYSRKCRGSASPPPS